MSSFMNKSLAILVILCVMAPSIYIDARPAHKASEMSSDQTLDNSKKTGSSHEQTGDLTQSTMSSQAGGDLTKPSGIMSQTDSTEQADEHSTEKQHLQERSGDSAKPSGSASQVDSSEQPVEDPQKKGTASQGQSGDSTKPSGNSSQADPSEQTSEDPTKKGETSQEQSGGSHISSDQPASPSSDESPANQTSSGPSRTSTERASTLHATGHYLGKRPSDSWLSAYPAEKSNDDVQAAECAHNLRVHTQNFAYFKIDPSKANNHGAPYGTCYATSTAPEDSDLVADENYDVFYWNNLGGEPGVGTGPIRNPETGVAGYEDKEGKYSDGENPDTEP